MGRPVDHEHRLTRRIDICGWINLVSFSSASILSYSLAPVLPTMSGRDVEHTWITNAWIWGALVSTPLLISTVVFVALLISISNAEVSERDCRRLYRWSCAIAIAAVFATPVMIGDFWHYIDHARFAASGHNPYLESVPQALLQDTPRPFTVSSLFRMSYGPAWVVLSAGAAWIARGSVFFTAIVLKGMLLAAWMSSLYFVRALTSRLPSRSGAVAIVIFGWLPLSLNSALAEGHNDVVMAAFVLLWLWCLQRSRPASASAALALSVLTKYLTAPLVVLDILHTRLSGKTWLAYWRSAVAGGAVTLALLPILRSPEALAFTRDMANWHFFTPADAVWTLEELTVHVAPVRWAVRLIFPLIALGALLRYVVRRDQESFLVAVEAVLAGIAFGVVGHMWPWFFIWLVSVAALSPEAWLTRWIVGVSLIVPFAIIPRAMAITRSEFVLWQLPNLFIYVFALAWLLVAPRRWFIAKAL